MHQASVGTVSPFVPKDHTPPGHRGSEALQGVQVGTVRCPEECGPIGVGEKSVGVVVQAWAGGGPGTECVVHAASVVRVHDATHSSAEDRAHHLGSPVLAQVSRQS